MRNHPTISAIRLSSDGSTTVVFSLGAYEAFQVAESLQPQFCSAKPLRVLKPGHHAQCDLRCPGLTLERGPGVGMFRPVLAPQKRIADPVFGPDFAVKMMVRSRQARSCRRPIRRPSANRPLRLARKPVRPPPLRQRLGIHASAPEDGSRRLDHPLQQHGVLGHADKIVPMVAFHGCQTEDGHTTLLQQPTLRFEVSSRHTMGYICTTALHWGLAWRRRKSA